MLGTFQKAEVWPTLRSGTGPRHPEGPLGTLYLWPWGLRNAKEPMRWEGLLLVTVGLAPALPLPSP